MNYEFTVKAQKVLDQVLIHSAVWEVPDFPGTATLLYQHAELMDEEAHPEPQKWMIQHLMSYLEMLP